MAQFFDGWTGQQTAEELSNERDGRKQRYMVWIKRVYLVLWIIGAELPYKTLMRKKEKRLVYVRAQP